jgi:glycosyltransferase involved in cell wall biosynthesis
LKVLHVVSVADAQSIPLELAVAIGRSGADTIVAAFRSSGDHPGDDPSCGTLTLGARSPFDLPAILRLRTLIATERPDILHVHHATSALWAVLAALTVRPSPILLKSEHNDHRFQPWHHGAINVLLYPLLSAIVCNSDTTLASFSRLERRLAGRKALRIYNGVNLGAVRSRSASRPSAALHPDRTVRIGHVARLVPQKNQARLIEGLAHARRATGRDLRLEIVGNGPLLEDLKVTARAAGVRDHVHFAGALTRAQVYDRLATWDAFVMPSLFEGFCNALVEAMAAGLPVAVSDIDTLREVAGRDVPTFDQTDPAAIGAALARLAVSPRAPNAHVDRFAIRAAVVRHLALYQALLEGRKRDVGLAAPGSAEGVEP